jgi:peptide/nickel transport system substrate-binding protein
MVQQRNRLSRTIRAAVAVAVLVACAACSGSSGGSHAGQGNGQRLVWGKPAEADTLDPAVAGNAASWELLRLSYDGLVGLDDKLRVVPEIAESWRQTSPTTYVFTLRKGVKFSNGRELTTDDVVGSIRRLTDPKKKAIWAGQLGIRSVAATGDRTVRITLKKPRTPFVAALAGTPAAILPMKELRAGKFDPRRELLGTGPYQVASHTQGESWRFKRNPHHWRPGLPKAADLTVRIMPEDAARAAALRDRSIDVTTFEAPDSIELLKNQAGVKTRKQTTTDYYRLDVNAVSSPFRDPRLREALALSVDRDKIKDVALGGIGKPSAAVPPAFKDVCDASSVPTGRPDPKRARQLVKKAGATGKTVTISTITQVPMSSPVAQVIQQNLQQAGLKVRIESLDIGTAMKRVYSGGPADFDLTVSWSAGYADPAMDLAWYIPELVSFNKGFVKPDPRLDSMVEKGLVTKPGDKRTETFRQACDRIARNANIIPLVTKDAIVTYRSDKAVPSLLSVEGYALPLRRLAEFGVR